MIVHAPIKARTGLFCLVILKIYLSCQQHKFDNPPEIREEFSLSADGGQVQQHCIPAIMTPCVGWDHYGALIWVKLLITAAPDWLAGTILSPGMWSIGRWADMWPGPRTRGWNSLPRWSVYADRCNVGRVLATGLSIITGAWIQLLPVSSHFHFHFQTSTHWIWQWMGCLLHVIEIFQWQIWL